MHPAPWGWSVYTSTHQSLSLNETGTAPSLSWSLWSRRANLNSPKNVARLYIEYEVIYQIYICTHRCTFYPRRCKTSSVGQSAGLSIPRLSVRFRQKLIKPENSNLHGFEVHRPSSKGTKLLFQVKKATTNHDGERALVIRRWMSRVDENASGLTCEEWNPTENVNSLQMPVAMGAVVLAHPDRVLSPLYFSAVEDQGLVRSHTSKFHHSSELLCTAFCHQWSSAAVFVHRPLVHQYQCAL